MQLSLQVHILAGGLGIVAGFAALYSAKGGRLHRRSGLVFVYALVTMAATGAAIAAFHGGEASVIAGVLAAYLVITALTTVRPRTARSRWLDPGAMLVAWAIGFASLALGVQAMALGGAREGIPAVVLFKFAIVALLGAAGDLRVLRSGPRTGPHRLARHLWRMCFALYIATASFFLGQADKLPAAIRSPFLLALPVLAVVGTMVYWLWRVRIRRSLRGIRVGNPSTSTAASAASAG